jgi:hypothetical protein
VCNSGDILFDNVLITSSLDAAKEFASKTWAVRYEKEKSLFPSDEV